MSLDDFNSRSNEVISPVDRQQQSVDRRVGQFETTFTEEPCLSQNQTNCMQDMFRVAGESPPPPVRTEYTQLQTRTERLETAQEEREANGEVVHTSERPKGPETLFSPDTAEGALLSQLNLNEGEQLALREIQERGRRGEPLLPEHQAMIDYLGKRLEGQGAERVKATIVAQYSDIPQVMKMSPKEAVQFAEQYGKVSAIYEHFQSIEGQTGMLDRAVNGISKFFGKNLLDRGRIGQGLDKLKSGQLLTEEEMSKVEEKMKYLDGEAKVQIYQKVIADMLERMVPGMNLAKDGFTGEALTADAINTISVLAMLVSGGGSLIANMGIKTQRIANGVLKADVAATAYGLGEGTVGLVSSVETGDTSGMSLNGAMVVMSALGLRAGIKGLSDGIPTRGVEAREVNRAKVSPNRLGHPEIPGGTVREKVERLYEIAQSSRTSFDRITNDLGRRTGALEVHNTTRGGPDGNGVPLKDFQQGLSKVKASPSPDKYRRLTDVVRGTMVYEDIPSINNALRELSHHPDVKQFSVTDRLDSPGVNDVLVNIQLNNGHTTELQFHIPEIRDAISKGIDVPETFIPAREFQFSQEMQDIVQQLKTPGPERRLLRRNIDLPEAGQPIKTHDLYEIMRSLPPESKRTELQQELYERLEDMSIAVHEYAKSRYRNRTGLEFRSTISLL